MSGQAIATHVRCLKRGTVVGTQFHYLRLLKAANPEPLDHTPVYRIKPGLLRRAFRAELNCITRRSQRTTVRAGLATFEHPLDRGIAVEACQLDHGEC